MEGLQKFLNFVNDNWTLIVAVFAIIWRGYVFAKSFISKSNDEKLAITKAQISETILSLVSGSEQDWSEYTKAGLIKRSEVIGELYEKYPILSKIADQTTLTSWIDDQIDLALIELRKVLEQNANAVTAESTAVVSEPTAEVVETEEVKEETAE